jgi:hypothetical protein
VRWVTQLTFVLKWCLTFRWEGLRSDRFFRQWTNALTVSDQRF